MPLSRRRFEPQVVLGSGSASDSHVMQWNPVLGIFRVNRYQKQFTLDDKINIRSRHEVDNKVDFIEECLLRNMDHCAEYIISLLDFEDQLSCLLVCHLWNEFISGHVFKRRVEALVAGDEGLQEVAASQRWAAQLHVPLAEVADWTVYKKMLAKIFLLRDVWTHREPKTKRLFCDSFVLSVKSDEERIYCGLNNGCVQVWNLEYLAKTREQECHDKGVKCMDLNHSVILTGSYDATFKVWRKSDWSCVKSFPCHSDSVWDLKLHNTTVATAGLDGTVILYDFVSDYDLRVRCYIQAHGDLVSAVDFSEDHLVTGYEDTNVGVWSMATGHQLHNMTGHMGGVTGVQVQMTLAATSSYDSTVRLWDLERGRCVIVLSNSDSFCRCVAFTGNRIVAGDFDGIVHFWEIAFSPDDKSWGCHIKNYRQWECHTGHIVCIGMNAYRIISGSRDKSLMLNDFWLKTVNALGPRENNNQRLSRFLHRPLLNL